MNQYHFDPETYLAEIAREVPRYAELQDAVAAATAGIDAREILELGVGTGETARRVLAAHPAARLTGIDASGPMLERARAALDPVRIRELRVARLEAPLPAGPFELVVSALAVHHLDSAGKRDLFARVAAVLRPGGRFVLADVVVPERPEDAVTPLSEGYDFPDPADRQLEWLAAAGLEARLVASWRDVAVLSASL